MAILNLKSVLNLLIICMVIFIVEKIYSQEKSQDSEVLKTINKGVQALLLAEPKSEETGIYLYTLIKVGISPDHPKVKSTLQSIINKFKDDKYQPTHDHIYETSLDIIALSSMENGKYKEHIQQMVNYLSANQLDTGGWFYINLEPGTIGDTSMIQYAMLGYWNAGLSGIELDANVLNKAADWLLKYQQSDGGFFYRPHLKGNKTLTMTSAAVGAIGIVRLLFHGDRSLSRDKQKTMGVLIENAPINSIKTIKINGKINFKPGELDAAADRGIDWLIKNYDKLDNPQFIDKKNFIYYYYYTIERMTAVHNLSKIGGHNWYDDGFTYLKKSQSPSGMWKDGIADYEVANTCFAILFLKKATNKILNRDASIGGGLLIGGRGLPEDLKNVTKTNTGTIAAIKSLGTMDDLLAELEKSEVVDLEATQQAIVETVQLGKPEELIGQREKLLKLVDHKDTDIRRTALWALSRCSVLDDAGVFVKKLDDQSLDVAVEARNGLCWMSHQINGLGEPGHPQEVLVEAEEWDLVSDERKQEAIKKWRLDVKGVWEKWYIKNRPYELRDDLDEPVPKEK